jgi:hypothetical protein
MSAIGATQQVVAAINQITDHDQRGGTQQHDAVIVVNNLPDIIPVDLLRIQH